MKYEFKVVRKKGGGYELSEDSEAHTVDTILMNYNPLPKTVSYLWKLWSLILSWIEEDIVSFAARKWRHQKFIIRVKGGRQWSIDVRPIEKIRIVRYFLPRIWRWNTNITRIEIILRFDDVY